MSSPFAQDLAAIARIEAVPTILRTITESTGLRFTLIARVLPDRWVACAVHDEIAFGLGVGGELDVATTLCSEVRDSHQPVVIDNVSTDAHYCNHPTPKMYKFQSYIAVPIFRGNGEYFGNVCGLDPEPHILSDQKTLSMMTLFSELISLQLDADDRYETGRIELNEHLESARLREQFIAVLGHDVRNSLSSIAVGTELLLRKLDDTKDRKTLERMRSSMRRITGLVDDLYDLARGRLGGGIRLEPSKVEDLGVRLAHVIAEVQASHTDRPIHLHFSTPGAVRCDAKRVEQLLSNLLGNAIEHGAPQSPIVVTVGGDEHDFQIRVENKGEPIPAGVQHRLFQPYYRGSRAAKHKGLGLGLYIASEIASSHGGSLDLDSTSERTLFTFTMPREPKLDSSSDVASPHDQLS